MPSAPSWLLNTASQTSHSVPKTPTIKKEPGTEESPRVLAQVEPTPKSAKRKARSESPSDSDRSNDGKIKKKRTERRNKFKTSEVWQYLVSLSSNTLDEPYGSLTKTRYMRNIVALPRKRELPAVWVTRLASEKPSSEVLQLLIAYLVGDDPSGFLCGLNGPDCAGKWRITGPAMATFLDEKEAIHKACAFPKCVFFPELEDSNSTSGTRRCCNAVYRDSDDPAMPDIWSPPNPIPITASSLASSSSSSSCIQKEPRTEEAPIAQRPSETKNSKREKRSESPSDSSPRKKQKQEVEKPNCEELQRRLQASELWRYISRFVTLELTTPSEYVVKRYERPRKRDLPIAWERRIVVEKPNASIRKLLLDYLSGDEELDYPCSLPGANCGEKLETIGPAIESMQQGKLIIYKECAFPRCVLFETSSGRKRCCNATYRNVKSNCMPAIWSPPASVPAPASSAVLPPVPSPALSSSSSKTSSSESSSGSSPEPSTAVERALTGDLNPETPSHQLHHEAQAQEGNGYLASLWEQRNEAMYLSGPIDVSTSYAHSAGWLHQREGQLLPIGSDSGATLQILDLENKGATVPLPSDSHNLVCIVFEGTVEVILQDTPVFTLSRGGQWSVGVGKECRVRNPRIGTKAILYNIGAPVTQNDE